LHYYTGKPCKNGHVEKRLSSNGDCLECARNRANARYANDPEPLRQRSRDYRKANGDKTRAAFLEWRAANRDVALAATDRWRAANQNHLREHARLYYAKRYAENIDHRLKVILRNRINRVMKAKRGWSFVRDLGCTVAELRAHIEAQFTSDMSWDNWGPVWQLDHIRPLVSFNLMLRRQFLAACNYKNLQPMLLEEHRQKSLSERRHNKGE
jgi:hypothetical protein